jgi:hypothetical protein
MPEFAKAEATTEAKETKLDAKIEPTMGTLRVTLLIWNGY